MFCTASLLSLFGCNTEKSFTSRHATICILEDGTLFDQLKPVIIQGTFDIDEAFSGTDTGNDGRLWSEGVLESALTIIDTQDSENVKKAIDNLYVAANKNNDRTAAVVIARLDCQFHDTNRGLELLSVDLFDRSPAISSNSAVMLIDLASTTDNSELRATVLNELKEFYRSRF